MNAPSEAERCLPFRSTKVCPQLIWCELLKFFNFLCNVWCVIVCHLFFVFWQWSCLCSVFSFNPGPIYSVLRLKAYIFPLVSFFEILVQITNAYHYYLSYRWESMCVWCSKQLHMKRSVFHTGQQDLSKMSWVMALTWVAIYPYLSSFMCQRPSCV